MTKKKVVKINNVSVFSGDKHNPEILIAQGSKSTYLILSNGSKPDKIKKFRLIQIGKKTREIKAENASFSMESYLPKAKGVRIPKIKQYLSYETSA